MGRHLIEIGEDYKRRILMPWEPTWWQRLQAWHHRHQLLVTVVLMLVVLAMILVFGDTA